jgi:prepilin peptidase CpaA
VLAASSDVARLKIPNWLTGALALGFLPATFFATGAVDWLSHLAAGVAVFAGAALLFACRLLGGGDVKLLAAVALWCGLHLVLPLLLLIALVGGVFALVVLALRQPLLQAAIVALLRRVPLFLHHRMPIPYGVPIAIGGIALAPHLPILG